MTILAIKYWQQTYHSKHTSFFKSSHQCNKGHQLLPPTKQDQLRTQTLPLPFQIRLTFSFANIAHNYQEQNLNSQHTALFESAKIKLSSSNKIHNCTTKSLPPDAISLFNKGTNFIPTTATTSISSLQETVTSKVNTARRTIPPESNHQTPQTSLRRFHPYNKQLHPLPLPHQQQSRPDHFNLHLIDYVDNTVSFTKEFLQSAKQHSIIYPNLSNIYPHTTPYDNDIISTVTDKNMGWSLVPTSWFSTEYKQHFSDLSTYRRIDNFNCKQPTQSPTHYLANSKKGFQLLLQMVITYNCWTLPYKTNYNCLT